MDVDVHIQNHIHQKIHIQDHIQDHIHQNIHFQDHIQDQIYIIRQYPPRDEFPL